MLFFKKKKRYIQFSILLVAILSVGLFIGYNQSNVNVEDEGNTQIQDISKQVNVGVDKELVFITHFAVGEDTSETQLENMTSIEELLTKHEGWSFVKETNEQVFLERTVDDLSPSLKEGSYFGIGPDGYLILYRGNEENKEVIETFFRIDVKKLESGLPREPVQQLYKGILIQDFAEFNSVLSTFSEFSID